MTRETSGTRWRLLSPPQAMKQFPRRYSQRGTQCGTGAWHPYCHFQGRPFCARGHTLSSRLNRLFYREPGRDTELGKLCNENPHVPLHPGFVQTFPFNFDGFLCPFGECFIARFLRVFCPWWLGCLELKNNSKVQSWAIKQPFKLCACLRSQRSSDVPPSPLVLRGKCS